jgi:gamma-glutamyltranspeptidase / glutathione hydrolase
MRLKKLLVFLGVIAFTGCSTSNPSIISSSSTTETLKNTRAESDVIQPEVSLRFTPKQTAYGTKQMVVTPHPLASQAATEVLNKGGNALDAAIAAQAMLTLVEPFASGIGGGGFLLYYNAKTKKMTAFDGRETAPYSAHSRQFMKGNNPMPFYTAVTSGTSVGVPGLVKMLQRAHNEQGQYPWYNLWMMTAHQAERGFAVSERLYYLTNTDKFLKNDAEARAYFYDKSGDAWPVGHILKNPKLSDIMAKIAIDGDDAFYADFPTDNLLKAVHARGGKMTIQDFVDYEAIKREVVCGTYRTYKICGMPAPSAGGIAVLQTMMMLEKFSLHKIKPYSPEAIHLITEAMRLAFADRNRYVADPAFTPLPLKKLTDKKYVQTRAKLIQSHKAMPQVSAGNPFGKQVVVGESGKQLEPPSTSHISIVDKWGNAASLTASIENTFGSRIMVDGYVLNNQLTDFNFNPTANGKAVANRLEPGKRPRSSMSPTLVFDKSGKLVMVVGSPGGARIIPFVIKTLIGVLDWNMDVQKSISAPNFLNMGEVLELEEKRFDKTTVAVLKSMGHKVQEVNLTSGINAIYLSKNSLMGGTDPRREGLALGR